MWVLALKYLLRDRNSILLLCHSYRVEIEMGVEHGYGQQGGIGGR